MDAWGERIAALHGLPEWAGEPLMQTHISAVLVGRDRVLKLKKPVDFGFLDYTTPEKRLAACRAEVELNSRLSPESYLGVETVGVGVTSPKSESVVATTTSSTSAVLYASKPKLKVERQFEAGFLRAFTGLLSG
jgi:aminoglycoside phosphotransferase family enzyme